MAKKKVYAVRKGKVKGVLDTWEACKASVDGYPGAEYKSFLTREEANAYLGIEGTDDSIVEPRTHLVAYVDGSFEVSLGRYSFGCVLLTPEGEVIEKMGSGNTSELVAIRNVAGEMLGAMYAVRWAIKKGYPSIEICYDYEGIEKWARGLWKAKQELTQKYAAYMQRQEQRIKISYKKIAAHTGDFYNEQADQLAKRALTEVDGLPELED